MMPPIQLFLFIPFSGTKNKSRHGVYDRKPTYVVKQRKDDLDAEKWPVVVPPLTTRTTRTTTTTNNLRDEVRAARQLRQNGVLLGTSFFAMAIGLGCLIDILNPTVVTVMMGLATVYSYFYSKSFTETKTPLEESFFTVQESNIPGAGKGLLATEFISKDTYLFPYQGERLTESEYFERYPTGQGRYVAEIPSPLLPLIAGEPVYIDGIDINQSGLARYMNSASSSGDDKTCNVYWKKQIMGSNKEMYFYARRDIVPGEELCFDYGEQYWGAVQVDDGGGNLPN